MFAWASVDNELEYLWLGFSLWQSSGNYYMADLAFTVTAKSTNPFLCKEFSL